MKLLIPRRDSDAHKGSCGKVLIIAGSRGMTGAAVLAARGALRSGAGLVSVGVPRSQRHIVAASVPEIVTLSLEEERGKLSMGALDRIMKSAEDCDAMVYGPGLGQNTGSLHVLLKNIFNDYKGKLILDADGINALCENISILENHNCDIIMTPHPGEMARLARTTIAEVQKDRLETAVSFAKKHGVGILLKGENTVVVSADGKDIYVNETGNCGMATGGTGDVLSGVIASFVAQGLSNFDAAKLGAYIHGKAGDMAAEKFGVHGMIAGDLVDYIAFAIKEEYGK